MCTKTAAEAVPVIPRSLFLAVRFGARRLGQLLGKAGKADRPLIMDWQPEGGADSCACVPPRSKSRCIGPTRYGVHTVPIMRSVLSLVVQDA